MSETIHSIVGSGLVLGGSAGFDGVDWDAVQWPRFYDPKTDDFIHPRTRRRMSRLSCMAVRATRMAGGLDAGDPTPLVFATANGEINTIGLILDSLIDPDRSVSPTQFHNSVHNAGPGYWAISSGRTAETTTISMGELSFECALLDAWSRLTAGAPEIQVTAGDEAITGPAWAAPQHCTHDLCGSLRLVSGRVSGALGRLIHVGVRAVDDPEVAREALDGLVERFGPAEVVADFSCSGG
ncbi:MAG: beta-ketoacyl synthase chain length factor, partial [Deltaproteobacteria bacterium]|nr:beta-ketoacyl synthase chain length factor [Deltaproteobacteria bacterium]